MATEWQVDKLTVNAAARQVDDISKSDGIQFVRVMDDANIIVFSILADKSTYCGNVRVSDTAVGARKRLRVSVSEGNEHQPPKPGGIGGLFAKRPSFAARPEVVATAITSLKAILPPI